MQKLLFMVAILFATERSCYAQNNLSPATISANGGIAQFNDIELEWTLGESAVGTATAYNRFYTIGFHQPLLISKQIINNDTEMEVGVKIFPNPVENMLTIQLPSTINEMQRIVITDLMGKTILEKTIAGKVTNTNISVGHLTSGIYLLRILAANGSPTGTFKIIKAN